VTNLVSQTEGRKQARVSEYSVLIKKYVILRRTMWEVTGENITLHASLFVSPVKYSPGEEIKMDQAYSMYRGKERCIWILGRKN